MPETLNTSIYDEIIKVENEDAFETGKYLAAEEAILAGISSGAALYAAIQLAKREENNHCCASAGQWRQILFYPSVCKIKIESGML